MVKVGTCVEHNEGASSPQKLRHDVIEPGTKQKPGWMIIKNKTHIRAKQT